MRNNIGLYRGKRLNDGAWQQGCLLTYGNRCFIIPREELLEGEVESQFYWHLREKHYEVDPETVGQFVGLTDDGTEIFEGDIVRGYLSYSDSDVAVVEYEEESFAFCASPVAEEDYGQLFELTTDVEVIGNIHDNAEWLKNASIPTE